MLSLISSHGDSVPGKLLRSVDKTNRAFWNPGVDSSLTVETCSKCRGHVGIGAKQKLFFWTDSLSTDGTNCRRTKIENQPSDTQKSKFEWLKLTPFWTWFVWNITINVLETCMKSEKCWFHSWVNSPLWYFVFHTVQNFLHRREEINISL